MTKAHLQNLNYSQAWPKIRSLGPGKINIEHIFGKATLLQYFFNSCIEHKAEVSISLERRHLK